VPLVLRLGALETARQQAASVELHHPARAPSFYLEASIACMHSFRPCKPSRSVLQPQAVESPLRTHAISP
jgi:hypothetical protein